MRRFSMMCMVLVLLVGLIPATQAQTNFESDDCPFSTSLIIAQVDCGYLNVPEDRSDPQSKQIRLPVAIFRSENPTKDPVFYLEGGPGGSALKQIEANFDLIFGALLEDRDLIFMDQRGTGYAEPTLACPEVDELALEVLNEPLTSAEELNFEMGAIAACHKRLVREEINLKAYNSAENAADFEDLRQALGLEQVNLYGISYGTRLALTIARDFPDGIRSIVLDSSYPLQVDLFATTAPYFYRAMQELFAACEAEQACNEAYPNLEDTLFETVERLNAEPTNFEAISPTTLEPYTIAMTGDRLLTFFFQAWYQAGWLPYIPQMIYAAAADDYSLIGTLYTALVENAENVSYGMNLAVQCSEEVPFSEPVPQSDETLNTLQDYLATQINLGENIFATCDLWGANAEVDPIENEPVISTIPTLILAGQFDPITPPEWGSMVQEDLSNSYLVTYPTSSHGASIHTECATNHILAFWDDPTLAPNLSCLEDIPPILFAVSGAGIQIDFEPFESVDFGVQGIRPSNWDEIAPATYAQPGLYDTALVQMSMPSMGMFTAETILPTLLAPLGVEEIPEPINTLTANDLEWSVYEVSAMGQALYIGIAEAEESLLLILLQTRPSDGEVYYEAVFLPALQALTPQ